MMMRATVASRYGFSAVGVFAVSLLFTAMAVRT
jgi:hypothetical protein